MALDIENGETFTNLRAGPHVVIPPRLVAGLSNYTTEYARKSKFVTSSAKKAYRPVFDDAVAKAGEYFLKRGALAPVRFNEDDVLVQAYPSDLKLAVVFRRSIAGTVELCSLFYDLPKPVLDALIEAAGKKVPKTH